MSKVPRVLGVIPARGGSKRLPRKAILPFGGKPLIAWTIEAAKQSRSMTDFLVSTDDHEIAEVAKQYGAPVPFLRPAELATDTCRNSAVMEHALFFMEEERGEEYDIIVLLQPTCPIRNPHHIDQGIQQLYDSDLDTAAGVKGPIVKRDPYIKAIRNGVLESYCVGEGEGPMEPCYMYNASLYVMKRAYLLSQMKFVSDRQIPIVMDRFHSIDIDDEEDFVAGEALLNLLQRRKLLDEK